MEEGVRHNHSINYHKSSRVSIAYNTNKIRDLSTDPKKKFQSSFTSSMVGTFKAQSLNKISIMKNSAKMDIIKLKCFKKPQLLLPQKQSMEDDELQTSYDLEEETDVTVMEKKQTQIHLRYSKYPGRPSTVFFHYPKVCDAEQPKDDRVYPLSKGELKYKINGWQYNCVINSLEFNGFQVCSSGSDWNIYFDIKGNKTKKIEYMDKNQKMSHFPGCWYIGRKDFLWRGIHKIRRSFPNDYDFVPFTYLLPIDFDRFESARQNAQKSELWILKPAAAACGRGIKMIGKETKVQNKKEYLISEYIDNPHLINNLKYDLRVYVVVTSYDPLRIYLFEEGLVRFATHEYTCKPKDIKKRYVHLTNFSVNKHSKNFVKNLNADADNEGSKWSFKALRKYYESQNIDSKQVFKSIEDVIIKTCISAEPNMLDLHSKSQEKRTCCFELYGFDILIDSNLKPWLMEVNVCPSLSSSSPMDRRIKHTLIVDLLNLIGVQYVTNKEQEKAKKVLRDNFYVQQNNKRIYSRNINNLENLNYDNCLEILSPEDWLILLESDEELDRLGHFNRIFPNRDNISKYSHLFEFKRYYNIMLWKAMTSGRNFLDHICQ